MDRINELNGLLRQLDHSDPIQIQAMIDLIDRWLGEETDSEDFQAVLVGARTHLWLDLSDQLQDSESFEKALVQLTKTLEKQNIFRIDVLAFQRVFDIMLKVHALTKDIEDLNIAIRWGIVYQAYATKEYPDYVSSIYRLASAFENRYGLQDNIEDLDESIELYEEALRSISAGDKHRPRWLNNLANALVDRYTLRGKAEDLDKSIELYEQALKSTSKGDKARPSRVNNLANALVDCYALRGKVEELDKSIELYEKALKSTSEGDKARPSRLNNLAVALGHRYRLRGKAEDLDKSIELYEEALTSTREGNKDHPALLNNLAVALGDRFALRAKAEDLDQSIELHEEALALTSKGGKARPKQLNNLANALGDRYALRGKAEDLDKSIELHEEALALTSKGEKDRPAQLNNLANALGNRFALRAKAEDLDKSIEFYEEALRSADEGDKARPSRLNNLAVALGDRYALRAKTDDLDQSIELYEAALRSTSEGEKDRPSWLNNLAVALGYRYALRAKAEDLDKSIELHEEALALTSKGDKDRPAQLNNLAIALGDRYACSTIDDDARKAREYYYWAITQLSDGHLDKPRIQRNLGDFCFKMGDYPSALEAYEGMAANLELLRSVNLRKQDREKVLSDYAQGFAKLVFCCLKLNQPEKALRYAEAAKSRMLVDALHNQVTDISKLATQDNTLKANLEELQTLQNEINWLLKQLSADDHTMGLIDPNGARFRRPPQEITAELSEKRAKEEELWENLETRAPVFAMTVSAPSFYLSDAVALADAENATLINYYQHDEGWVAFVVDKNGFHVAELTGVEHLLETYQSAFSNLHSPFGRKLFSCVLEEAWRVLIQPLQSWLPEKGSNLVIAPFAGLHHLPFAAFTNQADGSYLVDHYCLKSATSLGTLKVIRAQAQIEAEDLSDNHSMTIVGYASTPSSPCYLPVVEDEVNAISRLFNLPHPLVGEDAKLNNVLTQAPGSQALHFACHGMFDPEQPQQSGLMLGDGWLTVRDILTRMNLSGTDLVVMSACLSGLSRISQGEELTGLLTAFISARARSVVGSLWSVDDRSTAELMIKFYGMVNEGLENSAALREAQRFVREQPQWSDPYYWSPFFFTGIG